MSEGKRNRLIVVLGMHRSGTSTITKSLELLGVGLGTDLHPAGIDNPKGFWEDRKCLEINNSLLNHLGSAYDSLSMTWDSIPNDSQVGELRSRAIQHISRKIIENQGAWGFKDPRTCRLFGFWNDVFLALDCEVSFVIAIRNPASVVASLATRNRIPAEKAYFLWLQHVLPAMKFITKARWVVVDYDELLANPYRQVSRIAENLGLPLPDQQDPSVKDFESNFIERGLRHASFTEAELVQDDRAPSMVAEAYNLLLRLAKDQVLLESQDTQATLSKFYECLLAASPAFKYINELENELRNLNCHMRSVAAGKATTIFSKAQIERFEAATIQPDKMLSEMVLSLARAGHHKAVANIQGKLSSLIKEGMKSSAFFADSEPDLRYKIDLYQDGYFKGWILDRNRPLQKLNIEISQAGQVIASGVADQFRRDLAAAEIGDGCCSFKLKAYADPRLDGEAIKLRVIELERVFEMIPATIRGVA